MPARPVERSSPVRAVRRPRPGLRATHDAVAADAMNFARSSAADQDPARVGRRDAGLADVTMMGAAMNYDLEAARLKKDWAENSRWKGITRGYAAEEVVRLRGSVHIEHTLARRGAEKLWKLVNEEPFVSTLGAMTGNQAMQQVKAGLKAIYLSGWQVAADANVAGEMYPDQSLYPVNSVPAVVRRINSTFLRADQIQHMEGRDDIDYFAPIVADAEAGFGGVLNAFELMKAMIEAGAGGQDFGDSLGACNKRGATPRPRISSPPTSTTTTNRSAPASGPSRVFTERGTVSIRPLRAGSLM